MTDRRPSFDAPRPHQDRPLVTAGAPQDAAEAAVVLLHGRGATASGIVATAEEFYRHGVAFLAPQAARYTWFPANADAPRELNEPWLTSAVDAARSAVESAGAAGVDRTDTVVFGFSQGACVAAELARRRPGRYGGFVLAAGALPGTPDEATATGRLDGTPVTLAYSDDDPELDVDAVHRTARFFADTGADVTEAVTTGAGHAITDDAIVAATAILDDIFDD